MTQTDTIPRDTALGAPLAFVLGAVLGGFTLGLQTLFCAVLAALNLRLYRWMAERTVASAVEDGAGGGIVAMLMSFKVVITLCLTVLLLQVISPVALVLGIATVLGIAALSGTVQALWPQPQEISA
jgi:hypothetical protein